MNSYFAAFAKTNQLWKCRKIFPDINIKNIGRGISVKNFATKSKPTSSSNESENLNEPMNYFGSKAATWQAKQNRDGGYDEMLWYQPYVVSASCAIFLIYFCILREENDIDAKLTTNLFDHVSGLEETQLCISYKYNKSNGLDVTDLEKRLKELGIDVKNL